ncbi:TadE/TadG family type IV pilus assembly protein [Aneurinibacillus sp. REN35]|uniref:TadE/TadG family type IV pilus assembly protein n=1 Tax=Aneurinibacillus sp. REN35 TaxID=3237286 RepID=UPI003527765B
MMRKQIGRLLHEERGIAVVIFAAALPVFILIAGLVIDGGMLIYKKVKLSAAVDAASLAAVNSYNKEKWNAEQVVELDDTTVSLAAAQYLLANMQDAQLTDARIEERTESAIKVSVAGQVTVPLHFMSIFNMPSQVLEAQTSSSLSIPEQEDTVPEGGEEVPET